MKEFKIVIGKEEGEKPKKYMKVTSDGVVCFRKFREKTHKWSTKYGPYNTIKQRGGSMTLYDVGGEDIEVKVLRELEIQIDPKNVWFYDFP